MANVFKELELKAFKAGINPRSPESRDWFRKKISQMRSSHINRQALLKNEELTMTQGVSPGSMYMFFYDPKHKETLPFYDQFPLIIGVGPAPGGFYGLNVHYLPPVLRAKMLGQIMDTVTSKKFTDDSKVALNYSYLNKLAGTKYFKPCFHHYLYDHVKSKFAMVSPAEWEISVFLPTAMFAKKGAQYVYSQSRKQL